MFSRYQEPKTWRGHVEEALRSVKGGQHLRHINWLYLTKEVCLEAAANHGTSMCDGVRDIGCIPAGNLDYVYEQLVERGRDRKWLDESFDKKRAQIAGDGYFPDDISCWQDFLKSTPGAVTYDEYLEQNYNQRFGQNGEKLDAAKKKPIAEELVGLGRGALLDLSLLDSTDLKTRKEILHALTQLSAAEDAEFQVLEERIAKAKILRQRLLNDAPLRRRLLDNVPLHTRTVRCVDQEKRIRQSLLSRGGKRRHNRKVMRLIR